MNDTQLMCNGERPRVAVLGYGVLGSGVIEAAAQLGCGVTAVGRSPDVGRIREEGLFADPGVTYRSLSIGPDSSRGDVLRLLDRHDYVVDAREPYAQSAHEVEVGEEGTRWLYACAREAGFTVAENRRRAERGAFRKRLIRLGSPPAEIPRRFQTRPGFHEDAFSLAELVAVAESDPSWQNHYFQGKVRMALAAAHETSQGLDLVTVAPMYALAWWADHGPLEPVVRLAASAMPPEGSKRVPRRVLVPDAPTNCLPTDVAGRACLLVAAVGETGALYQLPGVRSSTFVIISECLAHGGISAIRVPVLRAALRIMRRSELLSGLLSAGRAHSWHAALTLEAGPRSNAKIRELNRLLPEPVAALGIPSDEAIEGMLPRALARKAEWLQRNGTLPHAHAAS